MRILVVEDEHRIANSIKKGLEQEHYAVDVAYDGGYGFDLATTEEYDVIVLDRMLPGIDGVSLCKKLRGDGNHTPILMLTAKSQTSDKIEGLDCGADDYLTKPFSFEELTARIRALIRRPKTIIGSIIKIRDLEIDTKKYTVMRSGVPVQLTSKEFALLEYLARNTGSILTKEQLIAHVWNYDADVLPNTVEVTIKNIRNKLEQPFPQQKSLIKTVRGFGYKMESS